MKILAIRGNNIASLAGEFTIDYTQEPLQSAGLYAITGQTGAGKSTILDVLSLALYGSTPRLRNAQSDNIEDVKNTTVAAKDARSLLRRGTVEGYAEVDFVGIDGDHYRVRWSVYRARKKVTEKLQAPVITLYNLTKDKASSCKGKKEIDNEIIRLTDLTYHQFVRTSLLAQGEFATFLRAVDGEKATLLEKLTGTEVYAQISQRIYGRCDEAKKAYQSLLNEMNALSLLTDEEVQDIAQQIAKLKGEEDEKRIYVTSMQRHLDWIKHLEQLIETMQGSEQQLKSLQEETNKLQPTRERVLVQEALMPLSAMLDNRLANEKRQAGLHQDLAAVGQDLDKAILSENEAKEVLGAKTSLKTQWDKQEPTFRANMKKAQGIEEKQRLLRKNLQEKKESIQSLQTEKIAPCIARLNKQTEVSKKLKNELKELDDWFEKNKAKEPIAVHSTVLLEYLNQASVQLVNHKNARKAINEAQKQITEITGKKAEEERLFTDKTARSKDIQQQLDVLQLSKLQEALSQHRTKLKEEEDRKTTLLKAKGLIDQLLIFASQEKTLQEELQIAQSDLDTLTKELPEYFQKLNESKALWDKKVIVINDLRLSLSENVVALRSQLREGEPCMVCGSKTHNHQYTTADALTTFLTQQESKLSDLERNKDEALRKWNEKDLGSKQLQKEIAQTEKQLQEVQRDMEAKKAEIVSVVAIDLSNGASIKEHADLITTHLQAIEDTIARDTKLLQEMDKKQEDGLRIEKELSEMQLFLQKQGGAIERMKQTLDTLQSDVSRDEKQQETSERELQKLKDKLSQYFVNEQWFDNWMNNPKEFVVHIQAFAQTWADKKNTSDKAVGEEATAQETLKLLEQEVQGLQEQLKLQQKEEQTLEDDLKPLQQMLYAFFEDLDLTRVELNHQRQQQEIEGALEHAKTALHEAKQVQTQLQERKKGLEGQQERAIAEKEKVERELHDSLAQINAERGSHLTLEEVADILKDEALRGKKKELQELAERLTRADQSVKMAKESVVTHESKREKALERVETEEQLQEGESTINSLVERKATLQVRWDNHKANIVRAEALQVRASEAQTYYSNWAKLNGEIGSAEGAAFKKIAQSYTLDLLLRHANEQMKQMAPRYELRRIADSLGLQVVDHEMCDQVRSVFSLSGGESFLISLALALGLSSLSSRQMNLESLFIDEGFGSLDQESLSVAMDALESLQLQGRKIGVISHVREMTERIDTRINVNKSKNGVSTIQIERS